MTTANRHYVADYRALVKNLLEEHPLDEAMSLAVGGSYREKGDLQQRILRYAGLRDGMTLVDVGCGSGRLAHALSRSSRITYLGTDVVPELLDYAKSKSSSEYRFVLHQDLSVPVPDESADFICAFSVFTHLLPEESFAYLRDMKRALKRDGRVVFTFLELGRENKNHWEIFLHTVESRLGNVNAPLNMFLEREVVRRWCEHLGLDVVEVMDGSHAPYDGPVAMQTVAVLRRSV